MICQNALIPWIVNQFYDTNVFPVFSNGIQHIQKNLCLSSDKVHVSAQPETIPSNLIL